MVLEPAKKASNERSEGGGFKPDRNRKIDAVVDVMQRIDRFLAEKNKDD